MKPMSELKNNPMFQAGLIAGVTAHKNGQDHQQDVGLGSAFQRAYDYAYTFPFHAEAFADELGLLRMDDEA